MRAYLTGIAAGAERTSSRCSCPRRSREALLRYLLRNRKLVRLKAGLLREPHVVVTDVPVVVVDAGRRSGSTRVR